MEINILGNNGRKSRNSQQQYDVIDNHNDASEILTRNEYSKILEALQSTEEKYKALQDNVPIGLYQTTPDGKFIYANNWMVHILGYGSPADLLDKKVIDLYVNPSKRKDFITKLNKTGKLDRTEVELL